MENHDANEPEACRFSRHRLLIICSMIADFDCGFELLKWGTDADEGSNKKGFPLCESLQCVPLLPLSIAYYGVLKTQVRITTFFPVKLSSSRTERKM